MEILSSFIVFEGLDGAGTTTQAARLAGYYGSTGKACHLTNEPTSNPIGTLIRKILKKEISTTPEALAMLYAADRSDHLYNPEYGIVRMLEEGNTVISDRYFYSSIAYQSIDCDSSLVRMINAYPSPEFLIFIDTPAEECMERIEKRGGEKELFDRLEFLRQVRSNYLSQLDKLPSGVHAAVIDGRKPIDEIGEEVRAFLSPFGF